MSAAASEAGPPPRRTAGATDLAAQDEIEAGAGGQPAPALVTGAAWMPRGVPQAMMSGVIWSSM